MRRIVPTVRFIFLAFTVWMTGNTSQAQQQLQVVAHLSEEPSFAVAVQDSIAVSGSDSSVVVFSLSDPARPESLSRVALPSTPDELAPRGKHLFVGACFLFAAVDVSDPGAPFMTDAADQDMCVGPLAFRGDTAFVPMTSGVVRSYMWDIFNPHDLRRLESFTSVTYGVAFTDSIFYSISSHGPWAAQIVSWSPFHIEDQTWFPDVNTTWAGVLENDHLFVVGAGGFYVYDTRQNALSPALVAHMEELGSLHDLTVANHRVYVASSEGRGLSVLDVSDPAQPKVIARFEVTAAKDVAISDSLVFLSAGEEGLYVLRDATVTATEQPPAGFPHAPTLDAPVPHPVSGQAVIRFDLPEHGRVRLTVYDMLGRKVTQIVDRFHASGTHEISWEPSGLAGGTYVMRLEAGNHHASRTFTLVR